MVRIDASKAGSRLAIGLSHNPKDILIQLDIVEDSSFPILSDHGRTPCVNSGSEVPPYRPALFLAALSRERERDRVSMCLGSSHPTPTA